jgi:uncharacterized protein YaeQ
MALKSTIYKANLQIADIDNYYYADHALTLARHPSETDERMMVRLAALALNAYKLQTVCNGDGTLAFGAGLSDVEDPDVSLTDFTGHKRLWIPPIFGGRAWRASSTAWTSCRCGAFHPSPPRHWPSSPNAVCNCKPRFKKVC